MNKCTQVAFPAKDPQAKEHSQQNHRGCWKLTEPSRYFDGDILPWKNVMMSHKIIELSWLEKIAEIEFNHKLNSAESH